MFSFYFIMKSDKERLSQVPKIVEMWKVGGEGVEGGDGGGGGGRWGGGGGFGEDM